MKNNKNKNFSNEGPTITPKGTDTVKRDKFNADVNRKITDTSSNSERKNK